MLKFKVKYICKDPLQSFNRPVDFMDTTALENLFFLLYHCISDNMDKTTLFAARFEEVLEDAHSDKLFCRIVSAAVGSVIRHSMDSPIKFRQQCYELLQVSSTKDAETELERRLMNVTQTEVATKQGEKQSEQTNTDELWLDKSSLEWDTVTEESSGDTDIQLTCM